MTGAELMGASPAPSADRMDTIYKQTRKRLARMEAELWMVIGTEVAALILLFLVLR